MARQELSLYHELSYQAYNLKDWTSFIVENGTSNIIALKTVFSRNTVDSPIYPRTGSEFSVSLALTPPPTRCSRKISIIPIPICRIVNGINGSNTINGSSKRSGFTR